jgi:phenylacetate-CoA ligase
MYHWLVPRVVFPVYERISGRRFWSERRRLSALQWRSAEELESRSAARLQRLLEHAATHVPYYRRLFAEAGVQPDGVRRVADLARLPLTTKAALRAGFPEQVVAENLPPRRGWKVVTSGSSGEPFALLADRAGLDSWLGSFSFFLQDFAGVPAWQSHLAIGGVRPLATNVAGLPRAGTRLRWLLLGQRLERLSDVDSTLETLQRTVGRLASGPYWIWCNPSLMAHLASKLLEAPAELAAYPTVVMSSFETLTAAEAGRIEKAFRCRVVNHYTTFETPHLAQSCPDNPAVLHVNSERAILRIVRDDGGPAAPGEPGRVVLTDLANYLMPLINYDVGDRAVAGTACRCGRGLPTLASLEGRTGEILRMPSGRVLSAGTLCSFMHFVPELTESILAFQAAQVASDAVVLRVVPTRAFAPSMAEWIGRELQQLLGADVRVDVRTVDRIPREASGKRLLIRSELPDGRPTAEPALSPPAQGASMTR